MGTMQALGMAQAVEDGSLSLERAISWHLTSNHYPPHPAFMVAVAIRAIRKIQAGDPDSKVRLPDGVEHRQYGRLVPAWVIADSLHLDAFLTEY